MYDHNLSLKVVLQFYLIPDELLKSLISDKTNKFVKMTMWADNIKFVKDILDGKYKKIDDAVAEVIS